MVAAVSRVARVHYAEIMLLLPVNLPDLARVPISMSLRNHFARH